MHPEIIPYTDGYLEVGSHSLYYEICGNPEGIPAVYLHGGPGSGCSTYARRFFDPQKYNVVLFDQRGSGRSKPFASLVNNDTENLVNDIEIFKEFLSIDKWVVFGGSWGSTLALNYVNKYPSSVIAVVCYGIFLGRDHELQDLYFKDGIVSRIYPDIFEEFINHLQVSEQSNPLIGYNKLFNHPDEQIRHQALHLWTKLEKKVSKLEVSDQWLHEQTQDPEYVLAHSKIENHYFISNCFFDGDALLASLPISMKNIPLHIIQGRYDMVCPFRTAWELHKSVPWSNLHVVHSGHSFTEEATSNMVVQILDTL
eukprot:TRINITY_DN4020_c0_g1_i1.p1 TRINITY_DN4020_c0_g1~~TRINITY_DN4020_c0_g1_i1.p1  ORF type:complete len:311 (+),score=67.12 TRINITY_DN4020_c0_g1_i1:32-964(+)